MRRLGGLALSLSTCRGAVSLQLGSLFPVSSASTVSRSGAASSLPGGESDGETTLPVWAIGWGQNSGSCVTPGVVWGGIY
jgi:hypothetical protein